MQHAIKLFRGYPIHLNNVRHSETHIFYELNRVNARSFVQKLFPDPIFQTNFWTHFD